MQAACLSGKPISFYRSKIKAIAENLLRKTSIKSVCDNLPRLQRLAMSSCYDDWNVLDYEEIRREIRDLAQFAVDNKHADPIFVST